LSIEHPSNVSANHLFRLRAPRAARCTDPRCKTQTVSAEDAEALKQLNETPEALWLKCQTGLTVGAPA